MVDRDCRPQSLRPILVGELIAIVAFVGERRAGGEWLAFEFFLVGVAPK